MKIKKPVRALNALYATFFFCGCSGVGLAPDNGTGAVLLWHVNSEAAGPPGVDASSVYALDLHQHLTKYSRQDGSVQFVSTIANAAAAVDVAVVQGVVAIAAGGVLTGVNATNGSPRWALSGTLDQFGTLAGTSNGSLLFPSKYKTLGEFSAIDPLDGSRKWTSSVLPPDTILSSDDQARVFTPAISGNSLAASFVIWKGTSIINRGGVALLDAATGNLRWSRMLPVVNATLNTIPQPAAIGNGAVVVGNWEGYVYCYDEQSGNLRWTGVTAYEANGKPTTNPDIRVVSIRGQVVVAGSGTQGFTGYDLQTGQVLWNTNPLGTGGVLKMFDAPNNRVLSLHLAGHISLLDATTGKVQWVRTAGVDAERINGLRISGDTVFGTSIVGGLFAWKLPQ